MIQSGRTRSVEYELERWYEKEKEHADTEWLWGFNMEAVKKLLDTRESVPFRCFFVRYLLAVHRQEMERYFPGAWREGDWLGQSAEVLLKMMEESEDKGYADSPREIRALTDLVFQDFLSNGFYIKEEPGYIRGSVNRGTPRKGTKEIRPIKWDKDMLLQKIKAKSYTTDFTKEPGYINKDEFFAFAFGLNMSYEDISYILRKAFRRADFNLWDDKEFLLYVTLRYADGDLAAFYEKLKEAYADETLLPRKGGWQGTDFSTRSIREQTEALAGLIKKENYVFALDGQGNLPEEMLGYLQEYKYLMRNSRDYVRTALKESERLLKQFKENMEEDMVSWRKTVQENFDLKKEEGLHAEGDVIIHYDPELGIHIPQGTLFFQYEKKTGKKIEFCSLEEIKREPSTDTAAEIVINVRRTETEKKCAAPQEQKSFIPGKARFRTDCPYIIGPAENKSYFKAPTKTTVGEYIYVSGKLFAKCLLGKKVKEGTSFYADGPNGTNIQFVTKEDVKAECFCRVRVRCLTAGEEALKNEITDCALKGWQESFQSLSNSKISLKKVETGTRLSVHKDEESGEEQVLYDMSEYLYQPHEDPEDAKDPYELKGELDSSYMEKLGRVLEGTKLDASKLSQIERKKAKYISRNDLLTLSFLAYMSRVEKVREEQGSLAEEDYEGRKGGFFSITNEILRKSGYYELYTPNPYDSLLVLLVSSNEGIVSYRNLWSMYLTWKKKKEEEEGEV